MTNTVKNTSLNRSVDEKVIENLYNDYNERKIKNEKLQKSIDDEQGITFKPAINHNIPKTARLVVDSTFEERNLKLSESRKNLQKDLDDHITSKDLKNSTYVKEQKVSQELLERLYNQRLNKVKEKNSQLDIEKTQIKFEKNYLRNENSEKNLLRTINSTEGSRKRLHVASSKSQREVIRKTLEEEEKKNKKVNQMPDKDNIEIKKSISTAEDKIYLNLRHKERYYSMN